MSKNKKDRFENAAAFVFRDINRVHLLAQDKIDKVLKSDIDTIMDQMSAFMEQEGKDLPKGVRRVPFPTYILNAFANVSTARWFSEYVQKHVKPKKKGRIIRTDLTETQIEALKRIISEAYTRSCTGFYEKSVQDYARRTRHLTKTFARLDPVNYRISKKLKGLSKSQRRDLILRIYADPMHNMKFIHRVINEVTIPDSKKLKILRRMYGGERFVQAVGAAMCVEGNNSDCLSMLYEYMVGLKHKKRAPYLKAYAEAYKFQPGARYFRLYDPKFWDNDHNKEYFEVLTEMDEGFAKAFEGLDRPTTVKKPRVPMPNGNKKTPGKRA